MAVLKLLCLTVFGILWGILWTAEEEMAEIEKSIEEGEFEMSFVQEVLDQESGAFVEIGQAGSVIVGTKEQGSVTLSTQEAYSLLDVLYRHVDVLRGRQDTVPLKEEPDPLICQCCGKEVPWSSIPPYTEISEPLFVCAKCLKEQEQWQASGTCQIDEKHTNRDVFRCDGCQRMCCNQCGETVEDVWLCESCLAREKATYPF